MRLPTRLRIGHATYTVKVENRRCEDDEVCGQSSGNYHEIQIRDDYPHQSVADTLLHEVMHQCLFIVGASNLANVLKEGENVEERFILALTGTLLGALRDNPELVAFLIADGEAACGCPLGEDGSIVCCVGQGQLCPRGVA